MLWTWEGGGGGGGGETRGEEGLWGIFGGRGGRLGECGEGRWVTRALWWLVNWWLLMSRLYVGVASLMVTTQPVGMVLDFFFLRS